MKVLQIIDTMAPSAGGPPVVARKIQEACEAAEVEAAIIQTDEISWQDISLKSLMIKRSAPASLRQLIADAEIVHLHGFGTKERHSYSFSSERKSPCGSFSAWNARSMVVISVENQETGLSERFLQKSAFSKVS